jgi:integrase
MKSLLNPSVLYRLIAIVVLTAGVIGLILLKPTPPVEHVPNGDQEIASLADSIDRGIDSLYRLFAVEPRNIRKRDITIPGTTIRRREHRVFIPPTFITLLFNQKLNLLAERFGGKAYGSENSKANIVTIHTRIGEHIIHSIVFRPMRKQTPTAVRTNKRK